jgi:6-pyruvoyltetrahydropterin/6-carboxytetrahydropterin synthase
METFLRHAARQPHRPPAKTPALWWMNDGPLARGSTGRHRSGMTASRRIELTKTWHFESARFLTGVAKEHRCARTHGSSFTVEVTVEAPLDPRTGWVVDFDDMEREWRVLHDALDHRLLNEVPGLENPTTEHIALWILDRLRFPGVRISKVAVAELPTAKVTVYA